MAAGALALAILGSSAWLGCGSTSPAAGGPDAGGLDAGSDAGALPDAGATGDGGTGDGGTTDAGADAGGSPDAGPGDGGTATGALFSHLPDPAGGLIQSSWVSPGGSDADVYAYDDFTLPATASITEVDWRGGYLHGYGGLTGFTVTIFASTAGGLPIVGNPQVEPEPYLARFAVSGNAGETPAGAASGVAVYDYRFVLPTPFTATGGTRYWLRIEAAQTTLPDWGLVAGTGGDGQTYRFSTGQARFAYFSGGDLAFTLR